MISDNLKAIQDRIANAAARAGRNAGEVRLVAVTKSVGLAQTQALADLGLTHFGENRMEQAITKLGQVTPKPVWHMIGNVQRRKVRDVVEHFDRVDAVDRLSLAEELEKRCSAVSRTMPILLEVNVSGEAAKHGFEPASLGETVETVRSMKHLTLEGLMTMAPNVENPEETRPVFARLRELAAEHTLTVLSMGMTNDFEIAIEEGSTEVRIGTALFQ